MPLRVIYRRALKLEDVSVNPTTHLELPAVEGKRERIATPRQAADLIDTLDEDQALWAFAFYEGLRRGELAALRVEHFDFDTDTVKVRKGWDRVEGEIELKSGAGRRDLPLCRVAKRYVLAHLMATGRRNRPAAFVFGRTEATPFCLDTPGKR